MTVILFESWILTVAKNEKFWSPSAVIYSRPIAEHRQARQCCPPSGPRPPRSRRRAVTDESLKIALNDSSSVRNVPVSLILLVNSIYFRFAHRRISSSLRPWRLVSATVLLYFHRRHSMPWNCSQPVAAECQVHAGHNGFIIG